MKRFLFALIWLGCAGWMISTAQTVELSKPVVIRAVRQDAQASPLPTPTAAQSVKVAVSYYDPSLNGKTTANGESLDGSGMTAAHKWLPFGTKVRVTNPQNHKSVDVRINDRITPDREDELVLVLPASDALDMTRSGRMQLQLQVLESPEQHVNLNSRPQSIWVIQLGSYKSPSGAEEWKEAFGTEAWLQKGRDGLIRVYYGAFATKSEAEAKQTAMRIGFVKYLPEGRN